MSTEKNYIVTSIVTDDQLGECENKDENTVEYLKDKVNELKILYTDVQLKKYYIRGNINNFELGWCITNGCKMCKGMVFIRRKPLQKIKRFNHFAIYCTDCNKKIRGEYQKYLVCYIILINV